MARYHQQVLADLRAELSTAKSQRAVLDLQCTRLQDASALLEERAGVSGGLKDLAGMSMPDAVLACLASAGRPLLKPDLMAMLREGGWQAKEHFSQHVYNTLNRLRGQAKVHCGESGWVLKESPVELTVEGQLDQICPGEAEDVVWMLRGEEGETAVHIQQGEFVRIGRESIYVKDTNNVGRRFTVRGRLTKAQDASPRIDAISVARAEP